jgi:hypothetical protein
MITAWLTEFHRQWQHARGAKLEPSVRPFQRDWEKLLEAAGIVSAEDIRRAGWEAEMLEEEGRLEVRRYRHRFIKNVSLPVAQEEWLRALFEGTGARDLRKRAVSFVTAAMAREHPRHPELWMEFCMAIVESFAKGRSTGPFRWRRPEIIRDLLDLILALTSREWAPYTLVRDADVALQQPTKTLERHRHAIEAALSLFFQRPTTLEALNIQTANSRLLFDGSLTLHFADGTADDSRHLRHGDFVTAADLDRAVQITTTARRLVSVENSKTTFRRLAELNDGRDTLLISTSFPTHAVRLLLEKLPLSLPHVHFGDTDPDGYFILLKLRELTARPVAAWQMDWQDDPQSPPLTSRERMLTEKLLASEWLGDCRASLKRMKDAGRKGRYEQESRENVLPP